MTTTEIHEKLKTSEYDFLRENEKLGSNIVYLVVTGSHGYGVAVEDSDLDIKGVYLDPIDILLRGEGASEQYNSKTTDTTLFSMTRFLNLLEKGDSNAVEMLFPAKENVLYVSSYFMNLVLNHRKKFTTYEWLKNLENTNHGRLIGAEKFYKHGDYTRGNKALMHALRGELEILTFLSSVYLDKNFSVKTIYRDICLSKRFAPTENQEVLKKCLDEAKQQEQDYFIVYKDFSAIVKEQIPKKVDSVTMRKLRMYYMGSRLM